MRLAPYLCLDLLLCFVLGLILVVGLGNRIVEQIELPSRGLGDPELRVVHLEKEHARSIALIDLLKMPV